MIGKEGAVTHISQDRGMFGHSCGLDNAFVFVRVQTRLRNGLVFIVIHHNHRVILSNVC